MAPLLFRDMKGLSCSSPASTAICPSLERQPMVRSHNKGIASPSPSPLAQVPAPRTHHRHDGGKKGQQQPQQHKAVTVPTNTGGGLVSPAKGQQQPQQHKAVTVPTNTGGGLVSPAGSSRYLLSSGRFAATVAEEIQEVVVEPAPAVVVDAKREEAASEAADAKSGAQAPQEQVVVLKVSLHCKACAGKVKKHLSKMEGVTSFNIDFAAKKVTVVGDVTPLGVLNSVSKVKNAQLWAAPPAIAA